MRYLILIFMIAWLAACAPAPAAPGVSPQPTLTPAPAIQPTPLPDPAAQRARGYLDLFEEQRFEELYTHFAPYLRTRPLINALADGWEEIRAEFGAEEMWLEERVVPGCGYVTYYRFSRFEKAARVRIEMDLDPGLKEILGLDFKSPPQPAANPYESYQLLADLRLPFEGQWCVAHGGRDLESNYHALSSTQRFAYDFLVLRDGKTHSGEGSRNEEYYCYGQPVYAPADGTVTQVQDGVVDNPPGVLNPQQPAGNFVLIDHGNREYSVLAHLQNGSLAVRAEQQVAAGQLIGRCGNSGNTTEPHLHFHVQDEPRFGAGNSKPAPFVEYLADGLPVERGEPLRGQTVSIGD